MSNSQTPVFQNSYADLPARFYTRLSPTPVSKPVLICMNDQLANTLGIDHQYLQSDEGLAMLAGNQLPEGAQPLAMVYAGHQFGGWSPQLGDGRALLLGEIEGSDGARYDIQLKGSGPTPYSRNGDGRAWLGPVLREYIVSESMAALGVPTTRALAAVTTGDIVRRETSLPGAILTRVALSHVRVGTFEYFAAQKDYEALRELSNYIIGRLYPELIGSTNPYDELLKSVLKKQAQLVAKWQGLGFIHGVMNTDNMSVAGETIDYGPCAFMDDYNSAKVFSSIDQQGRYAFRNQPGIAQWNLAMLAQSLLPIMDEESDASLERAQHIIDSFPEIYEKEYLSVMSAKIGLQQPCEDDAPLLQSLLDIMASQKADFTNTFRTLCVMLDRDLSGSGSHDEFKRQFINPTEIETWLKKWYARLETEISDTSEQRNLMQKS